MDDRHYRISSYCKADTPMCVGVSVSERDVSLVDTKNPDGPALTFGPDALRGIANLRAR